MIRWCGLKFLDLIPFYETLSKLLLWKVNQNILTNQNGEFAVL